MRRDYIWATLWRWLLTAIAALIAGVITCVALSALVSCKTCRETVTSETVDASQISRTDTLRVLELRRDSVVVRDSVFTILRGDTVLIREYHWRESIHDGDARSYRAHDDTCWRERTRTITQTRTVEVERQPTAWERFRLRAFWWMLGALALAILWRYRRVLGGFIFGR